MHGLTGEPSLWYTWYRWLQPGE